MKILLIALSILLTSCVSFTPGLTVGTKTDCPFSPYKQPCSHSFEVSTSIISL